MQRREKILGALLIGAVLVWRGWDFVRGVFLGRLDDRWAQVERLKETQETLAAKEHDLLETMKRMGEWKNRSLPADGLEAQRLYQQWLTDLGQTSNISQLHITPEQRQGTGPHYKTISVKVTGEATFEQLTTFLHEFQRIALLHRIASLKVEGPKTSGPLKLTMIAEGLLFEDGTPRTRLVARTTLADSLGLSFDDCKVVSSEGFPKEPGFGVRIEKELVIVTKIDGDKWTVKRAVDGTTKARHNPKAEVELYPIRSERKDIKLEDVRKSLVANPFVKPGSSERTIDPNDPALQTRLMASVAENDDQAACLYNTKTKTQTIVRKGTEISIGDIQGTVVVVEPKYIHIKRGNDVYQLNIGKDLRSMLPTSALSGGADLMDLGGDFPDGGPQSFARDRFPPGGRGPFGDPAAADGARGDRPGRGDREGQGGGGFRSRRSRGPDSLPGDE
jgi:Tfp pilus assembly protein PilO